MLSRHMRADKRMSSATAVAWKDKANRNQIFSDWMNACMALGSEIDVVKCCALVLPCRFKFKFSLSFRFRLRFVYSETHSST